MEEAANDAQIYYYSKNENGENRNEKSLTHRQ